MQPWKERTEVSDNDAGMIIGDKVPAEKTFVQKLRDEFLSCLSTVDNDIKTLIESEKEMKALVLFGEVINKMTEIHDTTESFYKTYCNCESILNHFGSKRLAMLGHELLPTLKSFIEAEVDSGMPLMYIEEIYLQKIREAGVELVEPHWFFKHVFLSEVFYMLDCLEILVEPEFVPGKDEQLDSENDRIDRYVPPQVKIAVWRRDSGKCVKCGSQERLEYDHIIPISKGGSNTERNIQLLCEKCNRSKGALIDG